jgi:beta-glucosidase
MADLGMQICRLGLEWARIEPEEGLFCYEALAHYIREIEGLRDQGIHVLVTLHHFTNPMWFEHKGGFEKEENIAIFIRYVEMVVMTFRELVNEYITINEPNVYTTFGYFFGTWPPGEKSLTKAVKVMSNLATAHLEAYVTIHALRQVMGFYDTSVSYANHLRVFIPENPKNPVHRFFTYWMERFFQGSLSLAMCTGVFTFPFKNVGKVGVGRYCDFHAINYYTRSSISGLADGVRKGTYINDLGWEIYPPGIVQCAQMLFDMMPLPIYITENGTCDNDDSFRCLYLYEHLKVLCESDLPIERYYHWCFCDNFEWVEGESARFGIVHIDYETQKRTVKKSGEFLRDVIKKGRVDEAIYAEYVKGQEYHF